MIESLIIILKIILAYMTGKLFSFILEERQYDTLFVMATLLPALLMVLILEIYKLFFFEYFIVGGMALLIGFVVGRRSLKWADVPLHFLFFLGVLGILLGLGYYKIAIVGIILGVITFIRFGKKRK